MRDAGISRENGSGEKRTFHSFRHSYAKFALESELPLFWLSRQLGHSSPRVTTDIYGHWGRRERKEQAQRMEGVFGI
jgi:integrase